MNDFDTLVAEGLAASADRLPLPPGDVRAVMARGGGRRRRRRAALSATVVVLLVGAVAGVDATHRSPRPARVAAGGSTLRRGDTGITWRHALSPSGLGPATAIVGDGTLYALSTAPGQAADAASATRQVLYRSADGVAWSPATAAPPDLYVSDLSATGDRLYAVGTGPATARTGAHSAPGLVADWSDDGASTWHEVSLPLDVAGIAARSGAGGVAQTSVVAGPRGVVVLATLTADLDLAPLLPAGVTVPNGWAVSATGVDLLGTGPPCPTGMSPTPPGHSAPTTAVARPGPGVAPGPIEAITCYAADGSRRTTTPQGAYGVSRSFSWDQLGVTADLATAVRRGTVAFWSADGSKFERIDLPGGPARPTGAVADETGFTVGMQTISPLAPSGSTAMLRSADGRHWASEPAPGTADVLGELGGRAVVVGTSGPAGGDITVSNLDGSGRAVRLADALDPALAARSYLSLDGAAVGPLGVVAVVTAVPDPVAAAGGMTVSAGGYTLRISTVGGTATVADATGTVVASTAALGRDDDALQLNWTSGTAVLADPATGAVRARFDVGPFVRASQAEPPASVPRMVLFSRDGVTWSSQSLSDLVGRAVPRTAAVANVAVTPDRVLVAVVPPAAGPGQPPERPTVLVGTV
ncbi:MAG: hypothetical protein ABR511_14195 [Acidimicrobiales bacterium]